MPFAGIARFPRARLGHAPTLIDPAPNLGAALGIDLRIKRDDCTGLAFGATRCASSSSTSARPMHVARIRCWSPARCSRTWCASPPRLRANSVWQSTSSSKVGWTAWARSTAPPATCCSTGCWAQPCTRSRRARTRWRRTRRWSAVRRRSRPRAARPYVIHSATGHPPLGWLVYVLAAEEIVDQAPGTGFDALVCASGSALTHAGIPVGLRALGERVPVLGCYSARRFNADLHANPLGLLDSGGSNFGAELHHQRQAA